MNVQRLSLRILFSILLGSSLAYAPGASAFALFASDSCPTGKKWGVKNQVKVLFHRGSFDEYAKRARLADMATARRQALEDIQAVIGIFNSVNGSALRLQYAGELSGDVDLGDPDKETFARRGIVVGFTSATHESSPGAEAWADSPTTEGCTIERRHLRFRKSGLTWVFGPPADTDEPVRGSSGRISFLAILAHEMGHAVGLDHPGGDYAVMAQGMQTWSRGPEEKARVDLLPDDIRGILTLYGPGGDPSFVDVSVTSTWVLNASELSQRRIDDANPQDCSREEVEVANLENAIAQAERNLRALSGKGRKNMQKWISDSRTRLAALEVALKSCQYLATNAMQASLCKVSSRADEWASLSEEGSAFCGVNRSGASRYPKASERVCPGGQIMMRYTLNNRSLFRDVRVDTEVWLSPDKVLNVRVSTTEFSRAFPCIPQSAIPSDAAATGTVKVAPPSVE